MELGVWESQKLCGGDEMGTGIWNGLETYQYEFVGITVHNIPSEDSAV